MKNPEQTVDIDLTKLSFNSEGLIPSIVQEAHPDQHGKSFSTSAGRVLMMAWMNAESIQLTLQTKQMHFWSRSRKKLWHKGEESGNVQDVVAAFTDCDGDTLLFFVRQRGGAACHTGFTSCFYRQFDLDSGKELQPTESRQFDPAAVYQKPSSK